MYAITRVVKKTLHKFMVVVLTPILCKDQNINIEGRKCKVLEFDHSWIYQQVPPVNEKNNVKNLFSRPVTMETRIIKENL